MNYTQTDVNYYHDLVDKRDARIEKLEKLVKDLAETVIYWAEPPQHLADLQLAERALKEIE